MAVDFSAASAATLRAAVDCAGTFGAVLHAVHVVDHADLAAESGRRPRARPEELAAEAERTARHNLADALAAAEAPTGTRAIVLVAPRPAEAILRYAAAESIDMIATGRGGATDVAPLFLGSTAQQLLTRASCPVLTVRPAERR